MALAGTIERTPQHSSDETSPDFIFATQVVDAFTALQTLSDERVGLVATGAIAENGAMQVLWADRIQQLDARYVEEQLDGRVGHWDVVLAYELLQEVGLSEAHTDAVRLFSQMPRTNDAEHLL